MNVNILHCHIFQLPYMKQWWGPITCLWKSKKLELIYENIAKGQSKILWRPEELPKGLFIYALSVCSGLWAPNLPRLEFFCQYKVTLLSLISEYKLAKEDFRHSTTLFKTLVSCMTCNVTHVGVCGSSAWTDSSLRPLPVKLPWVLESAFFFVYGAFIASDNDLLWQNLHEDSVRELLGRLLTSRTPNKQLCILNQSKFPNRQLPLLLPPL